MRDAGHGHLSKSILDQIASSVSCEEIGVGGTIRITAEDARSREQKELILQIVAVDHEEKTGLPRVVLAIQTAGFYLYTPGGQIGFETKVGTLVVGGKSMTYLPRPVYRMVGLGGPAVGRDYGLLFVGGENQDGIVHHITELEVRHPRKKFVPPPLEAFLAKVADLRQQRSAEDAKENAEDNREKAMALFREKLPSLPAELDQQLGDCCLSGILSIGSFLYYAHEQGQWEQALALVVKGFPEQWDRFPPGIRGDPEMGSNQSYLDHLYREAGVTIPKPDLEQKTIAPENADAEYQELRQLLETGTGAGYTSVTLCTLHQLTVDQVIICETRSGNRYLAKVLDPAESRILLLVQKDRPGGPKDGLYPSLIASDLAIGRPLNTNEFHSSSLRAIFLAPPPS